MAQKYFGTDCIRGVSNSAITPELAMKVAQATRVMFQRGEYRHRAVIGKDTRLSGYMIENALVAGFTSIGIDVLLLGPVPTPAVALLTRSMRADVGVMISASHNRYEDNGIKLFGPDGYKLPDAIEAKIEVGLYQSSLLKFTKSVYHGLATRPPPPQGRRLQGRPRSLVGIGRRRRADRRRAGWFQYQSGCRFHRAGSARQESPGSAGGYRYRARRRRRSRAYCRRGRETCRWRPNDGRDRAELEGRWKIVPARRCRDGHVEPRPRTLSRRARAVPRTHRGRRSLCARTHAAGRVQSRRRAIRPHYPVGSLHDRRRTRCRLASLGNCQTARQTGEPGLP